MTWYDIRDPEDRQLDELAAKFNLHPLHIEDCRHRNQNAKVEAQNGYLFVVLKPVQMDEKFEVDAVDLDLFVGPDYLITVQERECSPLAGLLERIRHNHAGAKPDQLLYRIADGVVDMYMPLLDQLEEKIDEVQDLALTCPESSVIEQIFDLRRALIQLRRVMANSRDVVMQLYRSGQPQISSDLLPFFRDIYDHIVRNLDTIELMRDLVTGATELYLSSVSNRTNQIMKVLTVFGTIATPALVITGLYGMNLAHLPFQNHPHSWGIVMTMIGAVSGLMLLILRRMHWF